LHGGNLRDARTALKEKVARGADESPPSGVASRSDGIALGTYDETIRRTISIEVGMQNSGLGAMLAQRNFPNLPAAATPCAISTTFHSVIVSLLAGLWRLYPPREKASGGRNASGNSSEPSARS